MELPFVAVPGDRDVDRVRALGRNAGVHVHGARVTSSSLTWCQSVFVAEQYRDERDRAGRADVVYEPEPARSKLVRCVRSTGSKHACVRRTWTVRSRVSGNERGARSGSDAHLSGLASARFGSLLSHRCPARLAATAVGNLTGDLHFVCLPEVI